MITVSVQNSLYFQVIRGSAAAVDQTFTEHLAALKTHHTFIDVTFLDRSGEPTFEILKVLTH